MARSPVGRTLVDDVYSSIKDDVCTGRLQPGQRLHLGEICKEKNVSLSVVREAVTRLASERLLQARSQQGFTVWPLSIPDLQDLTRVRIEIESLALRDSFANGDLAWEADVIAAHHRLVGAVSTPDAPRTTPNYAWMKAHSEFHAALAAACTSPLLRRLRQQLFDSAELYRHWSAFLTKSKRKRNISKEHRALLDAAVSHDVEGGITLITNHIQLTTDLLLANQQDNDVTDKAVAS
jgi:GntR family carbon starvation induced transcriptional regulator